MPTSVRSSPAGMVLRVLLLALAVLLTFSLTALLVALPLAWLSGGPLASPNNLTLAVLCGLVTWLFVAVFHLRTEAVVLPVHDRNEFFVNLVPVLEELGYDVQRRDRQHLVSRPTFRSFLLGGRLQVWIEGKAARVTGPRVYVEMLRRRLRQRAHLARAHQTPPPIRSRPSERRLKRVQIAVRVPGEQWHGVGAEAVRALAAEGAEVLCELHIFAQSDAGIREQTIEAAVRDQLRQHLDVEVREDHPQWEGPPVNPEPGPDDAVVPA